MKKNELLIVFIVGISILLMMGCQKHCDADNECWVEVEHIGYAYYWTYSQTYCIESSCPVNKNINTVGRHYCDCK